VYDKSIIEKGRREIAEKFRKVLERKVLLIKEREVELRSDSFERLRETKRCSRLEDQN
jgi:hypothetical protein